MTALTKTSAKALFETGDTPTQSDFGNLIDSYQDTSDILTAISSAASSGGTGIVEIEASADATTRSVGAFGILMLTTETTASAQGLIGGGTVTNVATGTGLTGGPITSTGTISVAAGGIDTTQLADDAVTLAKIAAGTDGELITWDASGNPATVSVGTAGQVLTSNGTGAAPTMQDAGGGTRTLLATATAASSATVDFNNLLNSTYTRYEVEIDACIPATDNAQLFMKVKTGASTVQSTNYNYVMEYSVVGSEEVAVSGGAGTYIRLVGNNSANAGIGAAAGEAGCTCKVTVDDPSNASYHTIVSWAGAYEGSGNGAGYSFGGGEWGTTTPVTGLQFLMSSGNISVGKFRLYGVNA